MSNFLLYILKSTLCMSFLYLGFRILMRKETFFLLNRIILLTVVTCSTIIPLLYLPQIIQPAMQVTMAKTRTVFTENADRANEVLPIEGNSQVSVTSPVVKSNYPILLSAQQLIVYFYFAGMLVSLLILIHGLVSLFLLFRKAKVQHMEGYRLIVIDKEIAAFSLGKFVIISRADFDAHAQSILAHEQAHIRLGHFYDLMLMEAIKLFHWFNPVIYWLGSDLKEVHEFQADDSTLTSGINSTQYQLLIIQKSVGPQRFALANSFNHCQIKNRITMMNKQKPSKAWSWKVATFLPLLALLLMAFGRSGENVPLESQSKMTILNEEQMTAQDPTTQPKEEVYFTAEVMAEFPGGDKALREYIAKNVKYPKEAEAKGIQGKVFVTFIVNSHGKIVNPKIARGVAPALDAEALRVVQSMPTWMPGKNKGVPVSLSYTVPILFTLGDHSKTKANDSSDLQKVKNTAIATGAQSEDKLKKGIAPPPTPPIFNIEMKKDGNYIDNKLFSLEEIRKKAEAYHKSNANTVVTIKVENDIPQERVNEITEVLSNAKIMNIKLNTITTNVFSQPFPSFNIEMRKDGNYIDDKLFTLEEIRKKAEVFHKSNTNGVLNIKVDKEVPLERVTEIKEVLRNAKIQNVNLSQDKSDETIYYIVQVMPQFPGGDKGLVGYIAKTVQYPKEAETKGIQGKVSVQFIVNKEGKVTNAKVTKSVDPALDAEALRVIQSMPNWTPGKQDGKPVSVYITTPINFTLQ